MRTEFRAERFSPRPSQAIRTTTVLSAGEPGQGGNHRSFGIKILEEDQGMADDLVLSLPQARRLAAASVSYSGPVAFGVS